MIAKTFRTYAMNFLRHKKVFAIMQKLACGRGSEEALAARASWRAES
jgi:hypothetical protein